MSLRTDLLKGLQNYAIFIPQLTRPVLRVLIQGKNNKTRNQSFPLKLFICFVFLFYPGKKIQSLCIT